MDAPALADAALAQAASPAVWTPERPVRWPRRALSFGLAVGFVTSLWVDDAALGAGVPLSALVFAVALAVLSGREGWRAARGQRWLLGAAVMATLFVALRASPWLLMLNAALAAWLFILAVGAWNGEEPFSDASLVDVLVGPGATAAHGLWQGGRVVQASARGRGSFDGWRAGLGALVRAALLAGPVLGLVVVLLAHGDASFGARLARVWEALGALPFGAVLRVVVVTATVGPWAAGLLAFAHRRRTRSAVAKAPSAGRLGAPEAFSVVLGLAVVLTLFSAVTAECALSPDACVLPAGMTYADYAHEGFFELMAAAAVVLVALLAVPARLAPDAKVPRWAMPLSASAVVVATVPMLASAFRRLMLYEEAYGFTRLRVASQVATVVVGAWLVWRGVTLWRWKHRFAAGAVAAVTAGVLALDVLDLEAWVARRNVERALETGRFDDRYLGELSADAAPVMAEAMSAHGERFFGAMRGHLEAVRGAPDDGLLGFNLARARARRLVVPAAPEHAECDPVE